MSQLANSIPGRGARILVAMSGGLDSAMAAALLLQQGADLVGATLEFWHETEYSAAAEARAVCAHLGIPHITLDARQSFYSKVVAPFVSEYARGRTPNPCVYCNPTAKFGVLLDSAERLGYGHVATGHYARLVRGVGGWELHRGVDIRKDQSYFLHRLEQEQLAQVLFPLGGMIKDTLRVMAQEMRLPNAHRNESQDLCFACDGDYRRFVTARAPEAFREGPILDVSGRELGMHKGLANYTIGQRGGLGVAAKAALYVLDLDPERNAVIVGYRDELGRSGLIASDMHFLGQKPSDGSRFSAQIRFNGQAAECDYRALSPGTARIQFDVPLRDIAPGQAVVLYDGPRVVGGGIIRNSF